MRHFSEQVIYRASLAPSELPLSLRSVGQAEFEPFYTGSKRSTSFIQIIWGGHGEGLVSVDKQCWVVRKGQVLICRPAACHSLGSHTGNGWTYRWCTMDGSASSLLVAAFNFPEKAFEVGSCLTDWFVRLSQVLQAPSPEGERLAGIEAYRFLSSIPRCGAASASGTSRSGKVLSVLKQQSYQANYNVQSLADDCQSSRFTVNRILQEELGVGPKKYIMSLRLQLAFSLLRCGGKSISQIAKDCGFANANYFCKVFKKKNGRTPGEFRRDRHLL